MLDAVRVRFAEDSFPDEIENHVAKVFAAMHAPQWPAPIAIFILSVALGTLYQRTGSLLAAALMHGTFNGFSTLVLLLQALSRQIEPNQAAQQVAPMVGVITYLITWG